MTFVCFRRDNCHFEVPPFFKFLLPGVALDCSAVFFLHLFYREDCSTPAPEWDKHNARYCYCCYYDAYDEDDDDDEDNNFYNFILIFIVVIVIVIVIFIVIVKVPISSKLLFPHLILNFMQ